MKSKHVGYVIMDDLEGTMTEEEYKALEQRLERLKTVDIGSGEE